MKAIEEGKDVGKNYLEVKAEWKASAALMTFDDAVKAVAKEEKYSIYLAEVSGKVVSLQERRAIAKRVTGQDIEFDWELPRTPLGQYMWQWSPWQSSTDVF